MPRIALVDDDRNVLTSVSIALEAEGYRVATYTGGDTALDGFRAVQPDLAILDIKMPRMDGMEMLRRLRAASDLPVIILTSKEEVIDELLALKIGADDFIRKPFSQRLLIERVKVVLRRVAEERHASERSRQQPLRAGAFPKISNADCADGRDAKSAASSELACGPCRNGLSRTFFRSLGHNPLISLSAFF